MDLKFTNEQIDELAAVNIKHALLQKPKWGDGEVLVSSHQLPVSFLKSLNGYAKKNSQAYNGVLQKLSILMKVVDNPKGIKVKRLDALHEAIQQATIVQAEHRLIFNTEGDVPSPWLVMSSKYEPANSRNETPAMVNTVVMALVRGSQSKTTITFYQSDLVDDMSVEQLFINKGWAFETPELYASYQAYMADWDTKFSAHYEQFLYKTDTFDYYEDDYSGYSWRRKKSEAFSLKNEFKVVNDVPVLKKKASETTVRIPALSRGMAEDGSDTDATDVFIIPIHPWVYVFNLETHTHMWIEPHKMFKYEYDRGLVDKLILPKTHKDLLRLLVEEPDLLAADVVKGKSVATIIMAAGYPGLGKSMSAEAFSEGKGMILYRIQSDQLGLDPESIEKNLRDILARVERWNAVLLVDEADIYVRERGIDIQQNAIVGTLLRTLEYATGVIFMTTNLATLIDDAIMSRCSAVLEYDYPQKEDYLTICKIFAKLFLLDVSDDTLAEFYEFRSRRISGRSIKNLLRLTARRGIKAPTIDDLKLTSTYIK